MDDRRDVMDREDFASHIERVMERGAMRELSGDRLAWWDELTKTVVVHVPSDPNGGTAFAPRRGRAFFEALR
jgi:hypothetical protein